MNILIVLTFNKSLKQWNAEGTLGRELKYYEQLSKISNSKITFLSYGDKSDKFFIRNKLGLKVIPIYKTKTNHSKIFNLFYSIYFIIKNIKFFKEFNFVKTNQNYGSWIGVLFKILNPKILFISRGGYDLFHFKSLEKNKLHMILSFFICFICYKFADKVIVPSDFYSSFVSKKFNIHTSKIYILPNYVDINLFKKRNSKKNLNKILFVGRFIEQKNLFNLLRIFSNNKYTLDLLGKGPQKNDLINYSKIINCKINILEPIKNEKIPNLFSKYKFFILNSYFEGNPKVLLEAMASELLCIGSDVIGINNIIEHKKNGLLIDKINLSNSLFDNLNNKKLIKKININSRKYIVKNHSLDAIVKKELKIYS